MDRIDWRGMFKRVVTRMRDSGESQEMGARWMAEEASNAVFALTEENKRLRAMVDFSIWKPIEMAPQDGTPILVGHEHAVFSAWWELDGSRTDTNHPAWVDGVTNNFDDYTTYEPTHWMPLPAPPVSSLPADNGRAE